MKKTRGRKSHATVPLRAYLNSTQILLLVGTGTPVPVNPEESHADGEKDDAGEDAEEEEQEDALGGLDLEEEQEVHVEGGLPGPRHHLLLRAVHHRTGRQYATSRAEQARVVL